MDYATYTVNVTHFDIASAYISKQSPGYRKHECCPIARAASRTMGRSCAVMHDGDGVMYVNNPTYYMPATAQQFVHDFDNNLPVGPIEFKLRPCV